MKNKLIRRILMQIKLAVIFLLFSAPSLAISKDLDFGGMVLSVSDAPTAQIFHIVDQLSQWDIYTHEQYAGWAKTNHFLEQGDLELLQQHAEMRKKRGWGHGFEQTFLVDDSIENAAAKGIAAQFLSATEANTERDILLHFAPKLEPLLRQRQGGDRHASTTACGRATKTDALDGTAGTFRGSEKSAHCEGFPGSQYRRAQRRWRSVRWTSGC
jgi:hypothetical protein